MAVRSQFALLMSLTALFAMGSLSCLRASDVLPPSLVMIPDQATAQGERLEVRLDLADPDTPPPEIVLTASSDNTALIPVGSMTFAPGLGSTRLAIEPSPTQHGLAEITVTARDPGGRAAVRKFKLTVSPRNAPPETTTIRDQVIRENGSTAELLFFVADEESSFESLTLSGQSSEPELVPASGFIFSGAGFQRSVVVRPASGQSGVAELAIWVTDPGGASTPIRFKLTVTPINQKPTISAIQDVVLETTTGATVAIPFTVGDAETDADHLKISTRSSEPGFLPEGAIRLEGEGAFRFLRITPTEGRPGSSRVTVEVRDSSGASASVSFAFTVQFDSPQSVPADFNGDGFPDIVLEDQEGFLACAFLDNRTLVGSSFFSPMFIGDRAWRLVNASDFNADRNPDLVFQHEDGTVAAWAMRGLKMTSVLSFTPARHNEEGWRLISFADIYGDGTRDFFFQNRDGRLSAWLMKGNVLAASSSLNPARVEDSRWKLAGSVDVDGDHHPDLLFQHEEGTLGYWRLSGLRLIQPGLLEPSHPGAGWKVAAVQDFDLDGTRDLMFQHEDGSLGIWYMQGLRMREAHFVSPSNPGAHWRVAGPR